MKNTLFANDTFSSQSIVGSETKCTRPQWVTRWQQRPASLLAFTLKLQSTLSTCLVWVKWAVHCVQEDKKTSGHFLRREGQRYATSPDHKINMVKSRKNQHWGHKNVTLLKQDVCCRCMLCMLCFMWCIKETQKILQEDQSLFLRHADIDLSLEFICEWAQVSSSLSSFG